MCQLTTEQVIPFFVEDGWMETHYIWPPRRPIPEDQTVMRFEGFSRSLHAALGERNVDNEKVSRVIGEILTWGGITRQEEIIPVFTREIIRIYKEKITDLFEILSCVRSVNPRTGKLGNWRIASWSKVLAAYAPGQYYIYDSRVAIALSYMSLRTNNRSFWQIPSPREEEDNPLTQNYRHFEQQCQNSRSPERNAKTLPICYRSYLDLLDRLADREEIYQRYCVWSGIKNPPKKDIMAHLEKMLFMQKERILNQYHKAD